MYRGVLYTEMGRKVDAQADLAALQKLNPQLAKDLAEVIKTGKERGPILRAVEQAKGINTLCGARLGEHMLLFLL